MAIEKSLGKTPTERLLAVLCEQTLLRLWSYPNPCKDDGDELCDLLAVFENHVFVFFDREGRHFANPKADPLLSWDRWKRKVIGDQVRTAYGAERYLRSGRRVFLDSKMSVPFPLQIPSGEMVVHKFVIAHGAKEACEKFSPDNIYGSLAVTYSDREVAPSFPFMIHLDRGSPVHVLDSHNLPILFEELDTFTDLLMYLEAKADALTRYNALAYCGEEDLLANYFLNFDEDRKRHFIGTPRADINAVWIDQGGWSEFIQRQAYKNKREADKTSYLWDEIIQRTCQNALNGTLLGDARLLEGRSAIHEMAKEPRFSRRALSDEVIRVIQNFPDTPGRIMRHVSLMPSFYEDKAYVFLQLRVPHIEDYEGHYRPRRQAMLEIACGAAKNRQPHLKTIVGIAIDAPKFTDHNAEDFILMDCRDWPEERQREYERANKDLGFFATAHLRSRLKSVQNFPESNSAK